jgi:hypothetical protein
MDGGKENAMDRTAEGPEAYEAPRLTVLGSVAELTLGCDKHLGGSDGFTFMGAAISCASA